MMMPANSQITLSGDEAIAALKEINLILISLHNIGSYYIDKDRNDYASETNRFIDEWGVTTRLAKVRRILSEKFDLSLGDDDMDDLERAMEDIKYWSSQGDNQQA